MIQEIRQLLLNLLTEYQEMEKPANPDLLKLHIEAYEDRLNRLMLIRERNELATIPGRRTNNTDYVVEQKYLKDRIAAIDAQLNKEETDGDVPTHGEPSKP